jgi:catechol 2,3-dioxygenase-like lactoylglutathione lyase family enzyme
MTPRVEAVHPVLMSSDVAASVAFYARLGFELIFVDDAAAPRYAAVRRDGVELHLQWHEAGARLPRGDRPVYRFLVDEPDALFAEFARVPGLHRTPVRDTPWGTREFHLHDPDGNGLQFYRPLGAAVRAPGVDPSRLAAIERHFHDLIRARGRDFSGFKEDLVLPTLTVRVHGRHQAAWFPVPGMYGGFKYWLEGDGEALKLVTESWCRVFDGSGQRHEITAEGTTLAEEGFV